MKATGLFRFPGQTAPASTDIWKPYPAYGLPADAYLQPIWGSIPPEPLRQTATTSQIPGESEVFLVVHMNPGLDEGHFFEYLHLWNRFHFEQFIPLNFTIMHFFVKFGVVVTSKVVKFGTFPEHNLLLRQWRIPRYTLRWRRRAVRVCQMAGSARDGIHTSSGE